MRIPRLGKITAKGALFLPICLLLLAACGSTTSTGSSSSSSTSTTSATATACAQTTRPATAFKNAIGILKSISGQTLTVTSIQGSSVTVTYSSSTKFTQEVKLASSDLKEGSSVRVTVVSTGSTYTAATVMVTTGTTGTGGGFGGFGGFGGNGTPGAGRNNPCFAGGRGRFGGGTPGAGSGTANFRGIAGTVSGVNGDVLTITDTTGATYTVNLTAQTQIIETKSATSSDLKVGDALTATGKPGAQNSVDASTIAILLSLPTRGGASATPTA